MSTVKQTNIKNTVTLGKQRNYNEIIEFLDKNWAQENDGKSLDRMKKLDKLFSDASKKVKAILITGTNGKSLTSHFAERLLQREGLSVGVFYNPHILHYNERLSYNSEAISNKDFTDKANEVISAAQAAGVKVTSHEILTQMALNYFVDKKVDVVLLESSEGAASNAVAICEPTVFALTRLMGNQTDEQGQASLEILKEYSSVIKKGTQVVVADQNKANLKTLGQLTEKAGGHWAMPIRKLVALEYPFEQLHGRCAALAERIAYLFINNFYVKENKTTLSDSILAKQKGQRGRPTLEAKRQLELNPKKTVDHFWKDTLSELAGRFQIFDKEKPSILLDNADNKDAFENLLLGIRLMHYQRPLKGLVLIVGCKKDSITPETFAKQIRYFFKKTPGQIIICPLSKKGSWYGDSWDTEAINSALKNVKVKSRTAATFKEAFEAAKKIVSDRNGLIAISGSSVLLNDYWNYKGIKKL